MASAAQALGNRERRVAWYRLILVVLVIVAVGALQYATPPSLVHLHYIYQRLFYLPVVYAALYFGWRGGVASSLLAGLSYFRHVPAIWDGIPQYAINQYLDVLVLCSVGVLTGVLAEREQRQRRTSEATAKRLSKVYADLQENFERMKRAERLYALGQLSAGLAHEIRNPLASIAGASGILKRNLECEPKYGACIDVINKECQRLNQLLTNFLEFARPREPRYQMTSIESVIDSVLDLASHAGGRQPIALRKQVAAGMKPVESDPEQVKQVLLNLVINAIQAMPEGGEVLIAGRTEGNKAIVEVKDQGSGISPQNMDRIFDPFFTTKEQGTGLGLPVAHQIALQLGGILSARRNPDRGMTFSLALPVKPQVVL